MVIVTEAAHEWHAELLDHRGGLIRRFQLAVGILWKTCGESVDLSTTALSVTILLNEDP
jgi:hypothetical protein